MLKRLKASLFKKKNTVLLCPETEFHHAMRFAFETINSAEYSHVEKIQILNYLIEVIKKDLQAELLSAIFYTDEESLRRISLLTPTEYYNREGKLMKAYRENETYNVSFSKDDIIVLPWKAEKLRCNIASRFNEPFRYQEDNHRATHFTYIDLCYIYGGIHSSAAGMYYKHGSILADIIHIEEMFPHIHTDGLHWYNSHNNQPYFTVSDFRVSVIYETAKLKYQFENDIEHSE